MSFATFSLSLSKSIRKAGAKVSNLSNQKASPGHIASFARKNRVHFSPPRDAQDAIGLGPADAVGNDDRGQKEDALRT